MSSTDVSTYLPKRHSLQVFKITEASSVRKATGDPLSPSAERETWVGCGNFLHMRSVHAYVCHLSAAHSHIMLSSCQGLGPKGAVSTPTIFNHTQNMYLYINQ